MSACGLENVSFQQNPKARDDPAFVVVRVTDIIQAPFHSVCFFFGFGARSKPVCFVPEVLIFFLSVVAIAYGIAFEAGGGALARQLDTCGLMSLILGPWRR